MHFLACLHVMEQLERAVVHLVAVQQWRHPGPQDPAAGKWLFMALSACYIFKHKGAAWRRFCEEMQINSPWLTDDFPGKEMLELCEAHLPTLAPTREQLTALLQEHAPEGAQALTTEDFLNSWRKTFDCLIKRRL
jgi:hypothetical protein